MFPFSHMREVMNLIPWGDGGIKFTKRRRKKQFPEKSVRACFVEQPQWHGKVCRQLALNIFASHQLPKRLSHDQFQWQTTKHLNVHSQLSRCFCVDSLLHAKGRFLHHLAFTPRFGHHGHRYRRFIFIEHLNFCARHRLAGQFRKYALFFGDLVIVRVLHGSGLQWTKMGRARLATIHWQTVNPIL